SVVVHYTCSGHNSCPPGTAVEQIESGCESGRWSNRVEGSTSFTRSQTTEASLSTTAREDCSACLSPELASELGITTDSVTHCVACNSACDQGLMRCFGPGASDCCNFYNNSVCVEQCPSPFLSNSDSICVCPEGKTGHNCEDVVDCGGLLAPASGLVNVSTTVFNSTATYSCNDGYSLEGDSTRTCLASGLWSGRSPQCTVVDCGVLVDPTSGAVTLSNTTFTSSATYSCNDGYSLVGDSTRTCLASGLWSGIAPNCTVVDCGGLPDPENGAATVTDTIFNSTATFSCNDGYNLVGEETRRCLASGSWSGSAPNCTEIDCGDLFDPTNGGVSVTSKRFNSTATYTCDSGYNLVGDTARTCLATASWSSFEPSCIVVSCGGLADPENGAVEVFDTTFTSTATYSCNDGYSLVGDTTRTCEASGLWSGTAPLCTVVDCGALEDPANGSVAVSDTTFNSTSSYSCSVGYRLDGESPRTCLATGLWSGSTPTCTVVDCGSLADPAFGEVRISDTTFASTATYTCSDGYSLVGDTTRTCLASGLWSGGEPTCTGHAIGSSCPAIMQTDVERVLSSYVAEQTSCSGQTNCPPQITIIDMYINCLSSGPLRDTYTHTTVTVLYTTIGMQYLAQADIGCSNSTSSWEASVLRYIASSLDQVFVAGNGTENEDTRTSCSACLSPQLATELGTTSHSIYHCVGCDDVCSATGAGLCYGPSPTECCSYYSPSNVCMSNCGPRRTYNSQWQCICASFWREPDCTVCDLSCENGGTPDVLGCTACHCPAGYSGTHCGDDIDECSTSETCSMNGVCTNSAGGFSCSCFAGYTGGTLSDQH
ncbi:CUB and sushi domain-containing protein 3, partial [Geodia barretti]